MALNARQTKLYAHTVDIWKPATRSVGVDGRWTADPKYSTTADYANVKCGFFPTQENPTLAAIIGRSNQDNMFTMDSFRFDAEQDIDDAYVLKLTTPGHPMAGNYWTVVGGPNVRIDSTSRKPNFAKVFAKASVKPDGIT